MASGQDSDFHDHQTSILQLLLKCQPLPLSYCILMTQASKANTKAALTTLNVSVVEVFSTLKTTERQRHLSLI